MDLVQEAKRVLKMESEGIIELIDSIGESFEKAVHQIAECKGKVVVAGMGKSGHIGRKMSATLSSTGTPSVFLHPAESSHGDLGVLSSNDLVIVISYGGGSDELVPILSHCARKGIPLIGMTGNLESRLAKECNTLISVKVSEEACPLGLAPTTSSTASLAMADALAMATLKFKGFQEEDFAEFHPGGSLGRRLLTRVKDVMHQGEALPLVSLDTQILDVVSVMTGKEVRGVAGVVDNAGGLIGVITDGDIRRSIEKKIDLTTQKAHDIMSKHPKTISSEELAEKALFVMEQFKIQTLFVVDGSSKEETSRPTGLLHLQDLLAAQIR